MSLYSGQSISLKGAHGKYLVGEDNGDLNANRTDPLTLETFTIQKVSGSAGDEIRYGDVVSIRGFHNVYVVAGQGGTAYANATSATGAALWTVLDASGGTGGSINQTGQMAFRSNANLYLVAEPDGTANANRSAIGAWEQWVVEYKAPIIGPLATEQPASTPTQPPSVAEPSGPQLCHGQRITLKGSKGKFLISEDNGDLNANRDAASTLETFIIEKVGGYRGDEIWFGDFVTLRSFHNTYVGVGEGETAFANATGVGDA